MNAALIEIQKPQSAAALQAIGLGLHAKRLARWVALYGARRGVTEAQEGVDPAAKVVDDWHVAWADLLIEIRSRYRDAAHPDHATIRQALLSPYEAQARAERAEEAKAQTKRRAKGEKKDDQTG